MIPGLLSAQAAAAESGRSFKDSWYWGINGGAMMFNAGVDQATKVTAPSIGGEWLITRSQIALRISVEQAFFDKQTGIFDASVSGAVRAVDVSDWRRYSAEMYFWKHMGGMHPYVGFGLALNVLQNATPTGSFTSEASLDSVYSTVNESSSRASAVFTGGVQMDFGRSALFVQGSAMPTKRNFLLSGSSHTFVIQAGLRYRVGSAIEKF